ncbi:MAG: hypothetical protein SFX72_06800 [Isosphaeraceae bacterium]|nr:hypothetical protein [Isosphaeraceae bacterium]
MSRKFSLALGLTLAVLGAGRGADAQFFYPYGMGLAGGGWGGWSSTAYGDIARGMGAYAAGAGVYNYQTAVARSINTDTVMRWNEYLFESQQETNRRYARRMAARTQSRNEAFEARQTRLRENPSVEDINRGDALNVLLDDMTNPRAVSGSSLRAADLPIAGRIVRAIPFFHASDAVTLSLSRLADIETWPRVLRGDDYASEREALFKAVKAAVVKDEEGDLRVEDVTPVKEAVKALNDKAVALIPSTDRTNFVAATNFIKGLAGLARMMDKPNFEKVLQDLDPARQATVGQLLGFMQNYNLRFGVAETPEQRQAYGELFKMLSSQRTRVLAEAKEKPASPDLHTSPVELFKDVDPKHLIPAPPAPAPR